MSLSRPQQSLLKRARAQAGLGQKTPAFFYPTVGTRDYGLTKGTRAAKKISLAEIGKRFVYAEDKDAQRQALQDDKGVNP